MSVFPLVFKPNSKAELKKIFSEDSCNVNGDGNILCSTRTAPRFRKLVPEVPTFQGTLELVGNFSNPMGTILDGWELIGNFYALKSGTLGLIFACFLHR